MEDYVSDDLIIFNFDEIIEIEAADARYPGEWLKIAISPKQAEELAEWLKERFSK